MDWPRRINRTVAKISPWWIYGLGMIPAVWYFWQGATGKLSANPVQSFEHLLGEWTLRFLIATLLVTPIRDLTRVNLFRFRRALGLMSFYYALMHVLTYAILDRALVLSEIVADIIKRPYIMVGMAAFVGLVALAVTSNNWSIRKMGRNWGRLHLLIYPAAILGVTHFIMAVKSWPPRPLVYIAIIAVLLLYRLAKYTAAQRPFASA
ncbi:protein-methionine-sulfoxide reductase heme-binding subunit MsrQ [Rhizobium sp. G21]|uniref:protein-methionine-sulfoxide reductase heme-binding subunit MsrQ n=1 Tax=unclassified Rhizobium TaxID=2613769 RepID=UPI001603E470|nr:protein-methionine-sulfoxide reductase heme-binding subunit MsrQ [Rhizobium sp. G21]